MSKLYGVGLIVSLLTLFFCCAIISHYMKDSSEEILQNTETNIVETSTENVDKSEEDKLKESIILSIISKDVKLDYLGNHFYFEYEDLRLEMYNLEEFRFKLYKKIEGNIYGNYSHEFDHSLEKDDGDLADIFNAVVEKSEELKREKEESLKQEKLNRLKYILEELK